MRNFKEFMESQVGLGDLGHRIHQYYHSDDFAHRLGGALLSTDFTGTEQGETGSAGHPNYLPSTDLTIPSIERTGRITILKLNRNPIYIRLSDGTEVNFTWDEFKKIQGGTPKIGKTMTLVFQRNPADATKTYSKVNKAIVQD